MHGCAAENGYFCCVKVTKRTFCALLFLNFGLNQRHPFSKFCMLLLICCSEQEINILDTFNLKCFESSWVNGS